MLNFKPVFWKLIISLSISLLIVIILSFSKNFSLSFEDWNYILGGIVIYFGIFDLILGLFEKKSKLAKISFLISFFGILPILPNMIPIYIFQFMINFLDKLSFISFPLMLIGLITAIISLVIIKKNNLNGKEFSWISIIIVLFIWIVMFLQGVANFSMNLF